MFGRHCVCFGITGQSEESFILSQASSSTLDTFLTPSVLFVRLKKKKHDSVYPNLCKGCSTGPTDNVVVVLIQQTGDLGELNCAHGFLANKIICAAVLKTHANDKQANWAVFLFHFISFCTLSTLTASASLLI